MIHCFTRKEIMKNSTALEPVAVKVGVAAELLGLSDVKTVYSLIKSGQLRARKVGRLYLVSTKSIRALIGE
ncbi:helix-turn-helix domain-containing protein [Bifidobacterium pullorum subsp. saeculare]|nr:helix-turn-helix domain-containing protein [Bifidobacterium pullorum subsp. saeculare]